jgi:DNA-nicking Smr family endonuclease
LSPEDDPVWARIKAQTKPLRRKGATQKPDIKEPKQTLRGRPIRSEDQLFQTKIRKTSAAPVREDRHKKVRRGKLEIDQKTDLHGLNLDQAHDKLFSFVHRASSHHARTLLVITGKGAGGEGILRKALPVWLAGPELSQLVSGFAQAHARHGGNGAWYVFLRKKTL